MKLLAFCVPEFDGASNCITPPPTVPVINDANTLDKIVQWGITVFIIVCVIIALFFLIWAGIKWTTSGGDKQKIASARQTLIYAIIGLFIIFLSFFIISIIGMFFGVDLITIP